MKKKGTRISNRQQISLIFNMFDKIKTDYVISVHTTIHTMMTFFLHIQTHSTHYRLPFLNCKFMQIFSLVNLNGSLVTYIKLNGTKLNQIWQQYLAVNSHHSIGCVKKEMFNRARYFYLIGYTFCKSNMIRIYICRMVSIFMQPIWGCKIFSAYRCMCR